MVKDDLFSILKFSSMSRQEKMLYVYAEQYLDFLRKDDDPEVAKEAQLRWGQKECRRLNNKLKAMGLGGDLR